MDWFSLTWEEKEIAKAKMREEAFPWMKGFSIKPPPPKPLKRTNDHPCSKCKKLLGLAKKKSPQKRDKILEYINNHGVGAVINYPAIHLFSFYRKTFGFQEGMFPNAEEIAKRTISLPLYPKLTQKQTNYVIKIVAQAISTS